MSLRGVWGGITFAVVYIMGFQIFLVFLKASLDIIKILLKKRSIYMYISKEVLKKEYHNPKFQLRDIINEFLDTLGCFNAFCKKHDFERLKIDHFHSNKFIHGLNLIKDYQSKFLLSNSDLYDEYFTPFKYEFKSEKLEEIKNIVIELKSDIKEEDTLSEEEQEDIIIIIDEVDKSLKPETNDIDTINGKLFRLKTTLNNLGINTGKVHNKINTIFTKVNDVNTFISNVQSIYSKVDGLITNVGKLLGS